MTGLLAVQKNHAQFFLGELECDRTADHAATDNGYIVCAHAIILTANQVLLD